MAANHWNNLQKCHFIVCQVTKYLPSIFGVAALSRRLLPRHLKTEKALGMRLL